MTKRYLLLGMGMACAMLLGCGAKNAPVEQKADTPAPAEQKADTPAPAEQKADTPAPAEQKADTPAPAEQKAEVKIVKTKMKNFTLVTSAQNPYEIPGLSPTLAADAIERVLVTSYEGPRSEDPWFIRIEGKADLEGEEEAYLIVAGQGKDESFSPVIMGAVSKSRKIYIKDGYPHEGQTWMHFGDMAEDAEEPERVE